MVISILLMLTAMTAELVRRTMSDQRQVRREQEFQQTVELALAGLEIGQLGLTRDPGYSGQKIEFPAGELHPTHTGKIVVTVIDGQLKSTARYPNQTRSPVQITRTRKVTP